MSISNSRRLRQKIEAELPELGAATNAVIMHPSFRELAKEFLITVHQMVRASVPLMQAAQKRCQELALNDPLAAAMVPYFTHHIREEMHHDDWLLEDLEFIGVPRAQVLQRMPTSTLASLIGAHYYWIHHHHPVAKLGQIAVMEGYPPTAETIDLLVARSGYPRQAFRTMDKHCHLDTHHRDEFNEALDEMPLNEEHHAILEVSAMHTVRMATKVYRELVERADEAETRQPSKSRRRMPRRRENLMTSRVGETGDYRLEDAQSGAVYQIGQQEYFLLTQCDGRTATENVRRAFAERFGQPLSEKELDEFLHMAEEEQLTSAAASDRPTQRAKKQLV